MNVQFGDAVVTAADFGRLRTPYPYLAFVPQWDFLDFLTDEARKLPNFRLEMNAEARELVIQSGVVRGLRYASQSGPREVRALLTVAADGRGSQLRGQAGLEPRGLTTPMDILWFRVSRRVEDPAELTLRIAPGRILFFVNRGDYWSWPGALTNWGTGSR